MRLLLVEDKDSFRRLLVQALEGHPWEVRAEADPALALEALNKEPFEVLVTDLRLPGMSGLELLKRAKRVQPTLRIVLMSAFGEPQDIVEAMRSGADDFLPKPFDLDRFFEVLERLRALTEAPSPDPREPWVAASPALRAVSAGLQRAADTNLPVLFLGEPGTGRSRCARRLHSLRHPRAPFRVLSCAALGAEGPDPARLRLLRGGSLFLQDLEELPEIAHKGLLRSLEGPEGQGLHWMAGARDAQELPTELRERLGVLSFQLPPLRERREDVLPLFRALLEAAATSEGRPSPILDRNTEKELPQRSWKGNARELAWCVAQALRDTRGAILAPLPSVAESRREAPLAMPWPVPATLDEMLEELRFQAEGLLLRRALERHGAQPAPTAAELGLTLRILAQRLKEHHISLEPS